MFFVWRFRALGTNMSLQSEAVSKVSCQRSVGENGVDGCIAQSYTVNNAHKKGVDSCIAQSYIVSNGHMRAVVNSCIDESYLVMVVAQTRVQLKKLLNVPKSFQRPLRA